MDDTQLLEFVDEAPVAESAPTTSEDASQGTSAAPWRILVVDDDPDVHESTEFGLRGLQVESRALQLLHAHSAAEALVVLRREPDVAVVLLDVVMESEDAGLQIVEAIRRDLGMVHMRIVLRTGQPGQAPEIETIRRYDINDYKTKGELTRTKLYVTLTTAIRAYDQLRRLDASRRGLEKIIAASNQFLAEQGLHGFAEGVITQIAGLLGVSPEGLVCASMPAAAGMAPTGHVVIAAAGTLAGLMGQPLEAVEDTHIANALAQALRERRNLLRAGSITLFFRGAEGHDFAAYIRTGQPPSDVDARLLEVFCANIALSASNIDLLARLREYAFVDRLLGLPNRAALLQHIDAATQADPTCRDVLALLDIDQFAETNDMFGHAYGDKLLHAVAQRLAHGLPTGCLLSRVAGDTFGVWGPASDVEPQRLRALFEQPFEIEGAARPVTMAIGLVRRDAGMGNGQDIFKNATIALKRAKEAGRGLSQFYTAEVGEATRERTRLLHGLQQAFDRSQLFVVYQPQIALDTGRAVGFEALLRWRTEDGAYVSPAQFIPVAEQSGLIVPIGAWVLRTALLALRSLGPLARDLRVAVNVSPLQFAHPQFLAQVDEALRDTGLPPQYLELEITESVAMVGLERVASLLRDIKQRGVAVAIDDFGTGFSSLSYLDRLPADRLKIDRAFVSALDSQREGARIADMIVPLGKRLGMRVLAEGVEHQAQADALLRLGCDEVQGFFYARPMALDALGVWLAEQG